MFHFLVFCPVKPLQTPLLLAVFSLHSRSPQSLQMALSRLLQPKSTPQICRLGFSTARTRCCFSLCFNGDKESPPELKKEAAAEETRITAIEPSVEESSQAKPGLFSMGTFIRNEVRAYGGTTKKLTDLFMENKNSQSAKNAENEGRNFEEAISDVLILKKHRTTEFKHLSHSCGPSTSGSATSSLDGQLKETSPSECDYTLPEYENKSYEDSEKMSSPSTSTQNALDLKDCSMELAYDQAAEEIVKTSSLIFTTQPSEHLNESHREDAEKHSDIKGLIDFIRKQEEVPSNTPNRCSKTSLVQENSLNAKLQRSDNNGRSTLLNFPAGNSGIEDEEPSVSDFKSTDSTELKASVKVSVPTSNKGQKQLTKTSLFRNELEENKVLIRFLPSHATESNLLKHFSTCGKILKVEFPHAEAPLFKTAYIYFETRAGLKNALDKSGEIVCNGVVSVESAASVEKRTLRIPVPSLIGDPDVPAALVKNPTRTIKIVQLTREISSHHIQEALAFCESNVSGYFLGSNPSVSYVEFETEKGKERALAKQSINVLGRHLQMLRIDSPRTTVVRISNTESLKLKSILPVCKSMGEIISTLVRAPGILDVHFGLAEWSNMLKILNRLNGIEIEGRRLRAESAPVFPPDVLLALWDQPEERKRLKATLQDLLHKLGGNALDSSELVSLQNAFVDNI
ncbi:hypothetical protein Salat_2128800 [Sesamum alatum]|uniref:RRM domain-containing protein n=1 Tax=Sesamum alatum TaxID=300844 RepID=A0AAE1Y1Z3_9LAMI|nr:hypothetical protein Salat_2128800 [Sesamum alatum]